MWITKHANPELDHDFVEIRQDEHGGVTRYRCTKCKLWAERGETVSGECRSEEVRRLDRVAIEGSRCQYPGCTRLGTHVAEGHYRACDEHKG